MCRKGKEPRNGIKINFLNFPQFPTTAPYSLMAGPPLRLLSLFVRQLSKPLALGINAIAIRNQTVRKICLNAVNLTHNWNQELEKQLLTKTGDKNEHDIQHGSLIISEIMLYTLTTLFIILEAQKSKNKDRERHNQLSDDIIILQDEIEHLKNELRRQKIDINQYNPPNGTNPIVLQFKSDGENHSILCNDEKKCPELITFLKNLAKR